MVVGLLKSFTCACTHTLTVRRLVGKCPEGEPIFEREKKGVMKCIYMKEMVVSIKSGV